MVIEIGSRVECVRSHGGGWEPGDQGIVTDIRFEPLDYGQMELGPIIVVEANEYNIRTRTNALRVLSPPPIEERPDGWGAF